MLLICNRAASLVGGRASGDRHLESNVARASFQLSASATLYTLQMKFSPDVIVRSSRSPFPRLPQQHVAFFERLPRCFLAMASKVGDGIALCYCVKGGNGFYFRNCFLQTFTSRVDWQVLRLLSCPNSHPQLLAAHFVQV